MSLHSHDNPRTKIDVEIIEEEQDSVSEFVGFPVLLTVDGLHLYMRKEEANKLCFGLQSALQELDRREVNNELQ